MSSHWISASTTKQYLPYPAILHLSNPHYFIIRAMPTARATRAIMIIVQIVIGLRLLILTSLRSDALLRLRLLLINWETPLQNQGHLWFISQTFS
jgi:hypothetical protein